MHSWARSSVQSWLLAPPDAAEGRMVIRLSSKSVGNFAWGWLSHGLGCQQIIKFISYYRWMSTESLPNFTKPAAKFWAEIPQDIRKKLLTNVWCAACHHEVTITNFTGVINSGDLLLVGKCAECHCDVARVVKGAWDKKFLKLRFHSLHTLPCAI